MRYVRLERGAELRRSRRSVPDQRNAAKANDNFGKQSLVESAARDGKSRCCGWVRVADGVHVRAHVVKQEMHGQLRRKLAFAGELAPLKVGNHQIFRREHAFV